MTRRPGSPRRQRGVALVTAVLVVALGAFLSTTVLRSLMLDLRRSSHLLATEQAYQYARGLEAWAAAILAVDYRETGAVDHRGELWAKGIPFIDVPGGRLSGFMVDLDGRFNLNNLVIDGQRMQRQVAILSRLLTNLGLDPAIAEAAADWIDADVMPGQRGAEDTAYLRLEPPYRTANRPFSHVSELRALAGVDGETYRRLLPYVTAVPTLGEARPINVNSADAPLVAALHPGIGMALAQEIAKPGGSRFDNVDQFLGHPRLQFLETSELRTLLTVESRYFHAEGIVEFADITLRFHALLERNRDGARVLFHSRGVF